ncbi:hypothetical protein LCGC14_0658060 [marine sediment metagenome]|uniref:MobA-like NTP transferase domain-containing protein n=1 Tax=marine sediment metagenome TaxID=412755 RepID=A0A0F9RE97_9ZZZZ
MKAVILAAGRPNPTFPDNSKQKVLYHINGEILLERMVRQLKEADLEDIRLVTGYGAKGIQEFNRDRSLGLELVYNPEWDEDPVESIRCGVKDLGDDALIIFGDILATTQIFRRFRECSAPLAWIKTRVPWGGGLPVDEVYKANRQTCIVKIAEDKLEMFDEDKAEEYIARFTERIYPYMRRYQTPRLWDGGKRDTVRLSAIVLEGMFRNGPVEEIVVPSPIKDVDYYKLTDEFHHQRKIPGSSS